MIQISNLNFGYRPTFQLFNNLSITQEPGSITGLLGVNGSGKSTLLKIIAGLIDAPQASIKVMNKAPFRRYPSFLEELFLVPEDFILPEITIRKYIKINAKFYPNFSQEKLEEIIFQFGINTRHKLTNFSHGQKKKFLIAFALSTNCKLLLFDEPTNGLDIPSKTIFRQVLASSVNENQLVLISTHQVKDVENLIDKILIINQGKIVFNQSLWDVSEKYAFTTSTKPEKENAIYQEPSAGGEKIIKPGNGAPSTVDIELLFNAVIHGIDLN
ncbi:ABC transporter ATP-binding protein [Marinilabilia rubra]|uniref:ABC transporter ATP-binding protein n=1 Tax=Marinilabilia rubra TaxID=2162893 RepID=A0A2U2BBI7_9BACT|nr:ABC transporter ATP-binding protein [Marinilabilia rubra]PWE00435.1 ABC transporter ATP-binding protein [Marinilabilia rubra]